MKMVGNEQMCKVVIHNEDEVKGAGSTIGVQHEYEVECVT